MSARPSLLQHELWELLMLTLSAVSDRRLSNLLFDISILFPVSSLLLFAS